ncbi:FHA domain-containing protein, partial [Ornithinicoccus halotolerans]|uniref:FHA domain-containing protein n=1 Tax=Ornithinicoccus halotolerans TaxID=1748220 RepID=UPI001295EE81
PAHLRGAASSATGTGAGQQEGDTGDLSREQQEDHTRELSAAGAGRGRPVAWLEFDGDRHALTGAVTTIGRDQSATIVLDDPGVSRRHAEVRIRQDGPHVQLLVRDLDSTNGTFVNGDEIGTEELSDGDRLTIGRTTLVVHVDRGR